LKRQTKIKRREKRSVAKLWFNTGGLNKKKRPFRRRYLNKEECDVYQMKSEFRLLHFFYEWAGSNLDHEIQ
jgi:hypothetical protein